MKTTYNTRILNFKKCGSGRQDPIFSMVKKQGYFRAMITEQQCDFSFLIFMFLMG